MKLKTKLTFICTSLLILTTVILTAAMLWQVRSQAYQHLAEQNLMQLGELNYAFGEDRSKAASFAGSEEARKVMLRYLFQGHGMKGSVLAMNGEILTANCSINPITYLDVKMLGGVQTARCRAAGIYYLITGTAIEIGADEYQLYVVSDASFIEENNRELISGFVLFSAGVCGGALLILWLVVHRALLPLSLLQSTTKRIASGHYEERVTIASKDEVGILAENFNQMAESVEEKIQSLKSQNERQRLFIGAVTHELKTPLTSLLLNVDTLRTVFLPEEKREELLEAMDEQLHWLEQMVHKLLTLLSVNRSAKMRLVPASELMEQVRKLAQPIRLQYGTELEIRAADVSLLMDPDLMCSAIINLIENSAKASKPGQYITLTIQKNSIIVSDQGCGIAAKDIDKITDPFYMGDTSRSKVKGGYGLGLALVKEIASTHGARLDIQSKPGQGTHIALVFSADGNTTVKCQ